jgi:hypothetical protein
MSNEYYNVDLPSGCIDFVGYFSDFETADCAVEKMKGVESVWLLDRSAIIELINSGINAIAKEADTQENEDV